jgi:hypothetical protein
VNSARIFAAVSGLTATARIASRRRWARWVFVLTLVQAVGACADDMTKGQFKLHASGDVQADTRGSTYATTEPEVGGYWIVMDLRQQDSPMMREERLSFEFFSKPDTGSWPGIKAPFPSPQNFTIGFGVGSCNGASWDADSTAGSYWHVDSGRVHVGTPRASPGVAGSFAVYTHLKKCVPGDTATRLASGDPGRRMVMEGTFATHPPVEP